MKVKRLFRIKAQCWPFKLALWRYSKIVNLSFILMMTIVPTQAREIKDLALGVALFEFFQEEDFSALSEILIAEQTQRMNKQADFASQFAAGIMLSYGMDREAKERLQKNAESVTVDDENKARSHYFLAKLLYRKGKYQQAHETLQLVDNSLTESLRPEYAFLRHSSSLRIESEWKEEETSFKRFNTEEKGLRLWGNYTDYNQLITADDLNIRALENLAKKISDNLQNLSSSNLNQKDKFDELLALRDKTLLSIAFAYLSQKKPAKAIQHLRAYSAEGLEKDQALLAYGWAHLQRDEFPEALDVWSTLVNGDVGSPATRESLLAIPYVYELQGQHRKAAFAYQQATSRLQSELVMLTDYSNGLSDEVASQFLEVLLNNKLSWLEDYNAKYAIAIGTEQRLILSRLREIAFTDEFILLTNQYRDVNWLLRQSKNWTQLILAMRDSIQNQKNRFALVFDQHYSSELAQKVEQLEKKFVQLQSQITSLETVSESNFALEELFIKDERLRFEQAKMLSSTLDEISDKLNLIGSSTHSLNEDQKFVQGKLIEDLSSKQATSRLLIGNQIWVAAEQSQRRIWQMKKTLRQVERSLQQSLVNAESIQSLTPMIKTQASTLSQINSLDLRLESIKTSLSELRSEISSELLSQIQNAISEQKTTIKTYLARAQLSRARLLDSLYTNSQTEDSNTLMEEGV